MTNIDNNKPNDEFSKVVIDFVNDIKICFPEVTPLINKWYKNDADFDYIEELEEKNNAISEHKQATVELLFGFCQKKFPPRFFDILYQNSEMFEDESGLDTEFLPHIHFKTLWKLDITSKTRGTIWKYLQLILFSIIGSVNNKEAFGDCAKLFDNMNEGDFKDEFKNKLHEALNKMQDLFDKTPAEEENSNSNTSSKPTMPNADDIHEHINQMLDGKIGKLAKEIAEETAAELNLDGENITDIKDVFGQLMKNPTKLMSLVKNVGSKLDSKIKSGELKESELIAEAADIMNNMKTMPGMNDIQSMLSKMGMSGMGKKMNMGAMEAQMERNMKAAKMRERMKAKTVAKTTSVLKKDEQIFSTGETVERTPKDQIPVGLNSAATNAATTTTAASSSKSNKKKKKNKK